MTTEGTAIDADLILGISRKQEANLTIAHGEDDILVQVAVAAGSLYLLAICFNVDADVQDHICVMADEFLGIGDG